MFFRVAAVSLPVGRSERSALRRIASVLDYLVLCPKRSWIVYFLAIEHRRRPAFDLKGHWRG
jgi:hypothetical protein